MPGDHPEDSIGDCITSVMEDNPELDEESAARICNASMRMDLDADQRAELVAIEQAVAGLGSADHATAIAERAHKKLARQETGQKTVTVAGRQAAIAPSPLPSVDPADPPEEFAEALDADDFVVYGKASIEKFDSGGENTDVPEILDMGAMETALDRFFTSKKAPGIISIGHDDIPVGRPLEEWTVEEDTAIEVDGETYEFEAGDTLTTHVEDGDGDGRPELWFLADLAKDTRTARKARLGVLLEELDGFSVTFERHVDGVEPEGPGRRVTSYHLFSVTLAPADMVANEGAEFDLVGFKTRMDRYAPTARADDATGGAVPPTAEELARDLQQFINEHL